MVAVERDLALRPERPQNMQALLPDRSGLRVVEAEGRELSPDSFLRVALAGAEDGSAAGEDVEGRPLQCEVQGIARGSDEARRAEVDAGRPLRDRRSEEHTSELQS